MRRTPKRAIAALAVLGVLGASCGSDKDTETTSASAAATTTVAASTTAKATTTSTTSSTSPATSKGTTRASTPAAEGDLIVFAAASLTTSFGEIGAAFSTEHPGSTVTFSYDASSAQVTQISQGAPADVFASADQANMTRLTDAGENQGAPVVFATNKLEIITAPGNPKGITTVADLADPDLIVVTCAPQVPIGKYTQQVFTNAGVTVTPRSLEQNVKGIVTKVTSGEADAGVVYATDVQAAGRAASGVPIPDDINVIASYPIVVTKESSNADTASAFIAFVLSDQGQKILQANGFTAP
jgi:molybdate transport system substrate-binding protein